MNPILKSQSLIYLPPKPNDDEETNAFDMIGHEMSTEDDNLQLYPLFKPCNNPHKQIFFAAGSEMTEPYQTISKVSKKDGSVEKITAVVESETTMFDFEM